MLGFLTPQVDLELDEGEQVLFYIRRHWILLLQRIIIPLLLSGLTIGIGVYRAVGGLFLASEVGPSGRLIDLSNIFYFALILGLAFLWYRRNEKNAKSKSKARLPLIIDWLVLSLIAVLAVMIYFRYQGGRVFYIDPAYARGLDWVNIGLFAIGLVAFGALVYIAVDWANDFLILTNTRVIYDDQQLLVRHVKQEVLIENIQQVNLSADSYLAYFLGQLTLWRQQLLFRVGLRDQPPPEKVAVAYGKLVIGSLSVRKLIFDWAANPAAMQGRISGELGKLRRAQEPELLRQIIEDQVYGNKPPKKAPPPIHVEERAGPLPWLFATNPEINFEKEEVVWRPYWIFLALAMLRPFAIMLLAGELLLIASRIELIGGGLAFLLWLPIALACLFRIIWVREEHEHDKYILSRDKITDVDKRPFGPESSRSAPLDRIQDVSFDVSFVESILGYGDVFIETGGGGGKFTFKHVPDARNVATTINDYLTDFKKREKERTQKELLSWLREYHAVQQRHGELGDNGKLEQQLLAKLAEYTQKELPAQIEREVARSVPPQVQRQMSTALRRNALRNRLLRRRSQP